MVVNEFSLPAIENAIHEVCFALEERSQHTPSWVSMSEDILWRELVACILGSRVRFEVAHAAVERMEEMRLLCRSRRSTRFDQYEQDVMRALSGSLPTQNSLRSQTRYPFFRIRANQIRQAAERLYSNGSSIRQFLENASDAREARRSLVSEVSGLGPKQASLFLRNVGYAVHIAVLDVHVLTYMSWIGLTDAPISAVSTVRKYETLEDAFIEHSYSFGHTPDRLDLAVWVVVRVVKEEYARWE